MSLAFLHYHMIACLIIGLPAKSQDYLHYQGYNKHYQVITWTVTELSLLSLDSCIISGSLQYYWIPALLLDSCIITAFLHYYWIPALSLDSCIITGFLLYLWIHALLLDSCIVTGFLYYYWIPPLLLDSCIITGFLHYYWIPALSLDPCIITGFLHYYWIPALSLDSCIISGSLNYYWIPALLLDSCIISGSLPYYWIPALSLDHSHYHIITCIIIGLPVKYQDYWHYHRICTSSFAELSALSWITVTAQSPLSLDYPHHHWITWIFTGLPALSLDYQQ